MAEIPSSKSTVTVSIISPNRCLGVPASAFLTPDIPGTTYSDTPCLSFLVEHEDQSQTRRFLFDLGMRKDIESNTPPIVKALKELGITAETPKDIAEILSERSLKPSDIEAVILSHHHFDHVGDLGLFPNSTALVVGPGFKQEILPGYPENPGSNLWQSEVEGRAIQEISFDSGLEINGLAAYDFFGDGSFYLLNAPGHAVGHMAALARTTASSSAGTPDSFMLFAGDCCHHAGALRPSYLQQLTPDIVRQTLGTTEKGRRILRQVAKGVHVGTPFYTPAGNTLFNMDATKMIETLVSIKLFDADQRVFVMLAHCHWTLEHIDLFPKTANHWKEGDWANKARWQFLRDFDLEE